MQSIENHDIVYAGREPRIARLGDGDDPRSWYARSRSRVATGLVLTSPGIPMLFMGQEILEDKPWSDDAEPRTPRSSGPRSTAATRSSRTICALRGNLIATRRKYPALRAEGCAIIHVHDVNRVLAFQRWIDGDGGDVVVVCSLNEATLTNYDIGFPFAGRWGEVLNSDVYDNWVNPLVAGNGGGANADGPPLHGLPASAALTIPANGLLIFAKN